ncbi:hypothetical protein ACFC09_32105 [Streptomyces sp. NPDC056161]
MIPSADEASQAFVTGIRGDRLCASLMESLMGMRPAEVAGQ